MAKFDDIFKDKIEFLENKEAALKRKVSKLEANLIDRIFVSFLDKLERDGAGDIVSNGKNITLLQSIDKIFDQFNKKEHIAVVKLFAQDLVNITDHNTRYFSALDITSPTKIRTIERDARTKTLGGIGINKNGGLIEGGFIDGIITDTNLKNRVKQATFSSISSGGSLKDLRNSLKEIVQGNEAIAGGLDRTYNQFAYDTFQKVDRTQGLIFSEALDLQAALYLGGTIKTSRDFCTARNGKIFTKDEIASWKDLSFQGKTKNYNPFTDQGGYNCRHGFQYIPNTVAARRRSDLSLDEAGNLVKG